MTDASSNYLWDDYVLTKGSETVNLWQEHFGGAPRDVLFVLGLGFDPRMCVAIESLFGVGGDGKRDCLLVRYDEGDESASKEYAALVEANMFRLKTAVENCPNEGSIQTIDIEMWSEEAKRIGPMRAARAFTDEARVSGYSDIVVDISALPHSMFFPILSGLLNLCVDGALKGTNLHVLVAEDVGLDIRIVDVGIDEDAGYMPGFGAEIDMESTKGVPKIWIPVLGENKLPQIRKIRGLVTPDEVCPVIAFPSKDPRRGDSLLLTPNYCRLFFDDLRIDPSNILYAHEQNPFQVYRQIRDVISRYSLAFESLNGCSAILSPLSSKLLSLGVLLAGYDLKRNNHLVGIANIDTKGYQIETAEKASAEGGDPEVFHLWLCGECYET